MSLAAFDARTSRMTWAGIGNVEGVLLRAGMPARRETITLRGGIVGYQFPALRATTLPLSPGDTLFLATDGIRDVFTEGLPSPAAPQQLADAILTRHSRGSDDALVLVARYLGGTTGPGVEGR
jgi:negative regulator of sigma-B (phosphoserine phosphatase)